jgi:hypothetical protein
MARIGTAALPPGCHRLLKQRRFCRLQRCSFPPVAEAAGGVCCAAVRAAGLHSARYRAAAQHLEKAPGRASQPGLLRPLPPPGNPARTVDHDGAAGAVVVHHRAATKPANLRPGGRPRSSRAARLGSDWRR